MEKFEGVAACKDKYLCFKGTLEEICNSLASAFDLPVEEAMLAMALSIDLEEESPKNLQVLVD